VTVQSTGTLTVAVLAGGRSSEHEISISSGESVREGLLAAGHEVVWVQIDEEGAWRAGDERLAMVPGEGLLGADVVFPVLHGPFGEDGTVQGLLETLDVAYVGAGVAASAVCMDKVLFKQLMRAAGDVPQVAHVGIDEERWRRYGAEAQAEVRRLGLPAFVKPAHLGSSVGIVKVVAWEELRGAVEDAFLHDARVIVEAMAGGIEVECAVLGCTRSERDAHRAEAVASAPGEIVLTGEWYDFHAKYAPGGMELRVPARVSEPVAKRVRELALRAFAHAGCEGLARVDFFVDGDKVLVNELNTMPGFTPTSVYAKLIEHAGVPYAELVDRLCRLALERHERVHARRH
jgi:D-alanine-D-alanine ligase